MDKKSSIRIYLPKDKLQQIKLEAVGKNMSYSEYVEKIIDEYSTKKETSKA